MKNNKSKPWLFSGIGNIFFNEDPAFCDIYHMIFNILQSRDDSLTFNSLLEQRDELIKKGDTLPLNTLMGKLLTEKEIVTLRNDFRSRLEENWLKYNPLISGVETLLKKLVNIYNIGLISNGPSFTRAILQEADLLQYLKVVVISEEFGSPKPNRGIFLHALDMAKEYSENADENFDTHRVIMVGDSIEYDIAPANQLHFTTVLLTWDFEKKYQGTLSMFSNDDIFSQYLSHLIKYSSRRRKAKSRDEQADYQVNSLEELTVLLADNFQFKVSQN